MSNEDGTIWITYNGEVYNHAKLRQELEPRGHVYKSHSDTETLLHAYEEWGIDFIQRLEGMFAIGLWDGREKVLYLIRDRIGVKPLYYTLLPGQILFGSEIKALLCHLHVSKEMDLNAFYHYLTFAATPAPFTMFKGIKKLDPGHFIRVDQAGHAQIVQYWDPIVNNDGDQSFYSNEDYCIREIRRLLLESVEKRLMSDVPFGVFLSGGVDSSTNVALMSQLMNRPVDTFSVGFKGESPFDELLYARRIAEHLKTNHHEVLIGEREFLDCFCTLAFYQDEPLADPVCVPLYYVAQLARKNGTIVIQVGEGSDELFSGYDSYLQYFKRWKRIWRPYQKVPYNIRKFLNDIAGRRFQRGKREFLRRAANEEGFFWGSTTAFLESEKEDLLSPQVLKDVNGNNSWEVVQRFWEVVGAKTSNSDFLKKMIYLEIKNRLPELLLMRVDKMTMANSVEARVPFLDHKIVEMAMKIPSEYKVRGGIGKYILKKAVRGLIPDEIIDRPKVGFCGSSNNMLTGGLLQFAEAMYHKKRNGLQSFFVPPYLETLFSDHRSGRYDNSFKIWNLLNFGLWYDHWFK